SRSGTQGAAFAGGQRQARGRRNAKCQARHPGVRELGISHPGGQPPAEVVDSGVGGAVVSGLTGTVVSPLAGFDGGDSSGRVASSPWPHSTNPLADDSELFEVDSASVDEVSVGTSPPPTASVFAVVAPPASSVPATASPAQVFSSSSFFSRSSRSRLRTPGFLLCEPAVRSGFSECPVSLASVEVVDSFELAPWSVGVVAGTGPGSAPEPAA